MRRTAYLALRITLALLVTCSVARAQVQREELHSFPVQTSHSALTQASDGNFYGTSSGLNSSGDPLSDGDVYRLSADGAVTVLHEFSGAADGAIPLAGLVEGPDGLLYGTAQRGGPKNYGTVFRMTLDGLLEVVHTFTNDRDGAHPGKGGLALGRDGHFYGTSVANCGTSNCGAVIFRLTQSGTLAPLHTFREGCADVPGRLVQTEDGNLYGAVRCGGQGQGQIFRLTPAGVVDVVYDFAQGTDGSDPNGVIAASDGNLYGTTTTGGPNGYGTVFKLTTSGTMTALHAFGLEPDGGFPAASLVQGSDGFLYGATVQGGEDGHPGYGGGTVFKLSLDGEFTITHRFEASLNTRGASQDAALTTGRDGKIYGVARVGDNGMIFRLSALSTGEMAVETPGPGQQVAVPFVLQGWAIDRAAQFDSGVDAVHVWARPLDGGEAVFIGSTGYGGIRPDVAAVYGEQFTRSGFGITVRGLPKGHDYELILTPHSSVSNTFDSSAARTVTVFVSAENGSIPVAVIDTPGPDSFVWPGFTVSGWAACLGAEPGTVVDAVHVWAVPESGAPSTFLGVANHGEPRPDVAAAFGWQYLNVGYSIVSPHLALGRYLIVSFARCTYGPNFGWIQISRKIEVVADTRLTIDGPLPGTVSQPFLISGWAIDLATAGGSGVDAVHIWAFPTDGAAGQFLGAAPSSARPDVAAIYGSNFANSGWSLTVNTLAPGTYDLIVFARSTVTNSFNASRVVRVTIQ